MGINEEQYEMIFKRKSFRRFNETLKLTNEELCDINEKIKTLRPLIDNINVKYCIVRRGETTCKRGEYCLLIYSEEKANYLLNIGYMFEQLDLYLASKDIGVCWYGMGKTQEAEYKNLKFVIMIALGKTEPREFRKDYTKCKRKETKEICKGVSGLKTIAEVVKYAPSACNTQPWRIICEENKLKIYRTTDIKSIMPKEKVPFYNSIDIGIFIYFLEITLEYNNISYQRLLLNEENKSDLILMAEYNLLYL
ncbi:nitroreductase [Clostridium gasigenes]|uniref:nitroreductase family protein n=1 Tax=Clostridium gasigenes TaxID=94869 RepID=UPI001C0CF37F|nr:nitroreductase family protein [Clostridium gasigenes]MBU3136775.1 nitroreductase [Clostridium gasigenes]